MDPTTEINNLDRTNPLNAGPLSRKRIQNDVSAADLASEEIKHVSNFIEEILDRNTKISGTKESIFQNVFLAKVSDAKYIGPNLSYTNDQIEYRNQGSKIAKLTYDGDAVGRNAVPLEVLAQLGNLSQQQQGGTSGPAGTSVTTPGPGTSGTSMLTRQSQKFPGQQLQNQQQDFQSSQGLGGGESGFGEADDPGVEDVGPATGAGLGEIDTNLNDTVTTTGPLTSTSNNNNMSQSPTKAQKKSISAGAATSMPFNASGILGASKSGNIPLVPKDGQNQRERVILTRSAKKKKRDFKVQQLEQLQKIQQWQLSQTQIQQQPQQNQNQIQPQPAQDKNISKDEVTNDIIDDSVDQPTASSGLRSSTNQNTVRKSISLADLNQQQLTNQIKPTSEIDQLISTLKSDSSNDLLSYQRRPSHNSAPSINTGTLQKQLEKSKLKNSQLYNTGNLSTIPDSMSEESSMVGTAGEASMNNTVNQLMASALATTFGQNAGKAAILSGLGTLSSKTGVNIGPTGQSAITIRPGNNLNDSNYCRNIVSNTLKYNSTGFVVGGPCHYAGKQLKPLKRVPSPPLSPLPGSPSAKRLAASQKKMNVLSQTQTQSQEDGDLDQQQQQLNLYEDITQQQQVQYYETIPYTKISKQAEKTKKLLEQKKLDAGILGGNSRDRDSKEKEELMKKTQAFNKNVQVCENLGKRILSGVDFNPMALIGQNQPSKEEEAEMLRRQKEKEAQAKPQDILAIMMGQANKQQSKGSGYNWKRKYIEQPDPSGLFSNQYERVCYFRSHKKLEINQELPPLSKENLCPQWFSDMKKNQFKTRRGNEQYVSPMVRNASWAYLKEFLPNHRFQKYKNSVRIWEQKNERFAQNRQQQSDLREQQIWAELARKKFAAQYLGSNKEELERMKEEESLKSKEDFEKCQKKMITYIWIVLFIHELRCKIEERKKLAIQQQQQQQNLNQTQNSMSQTQQTFMTQDGTQSAIDIEGTADMSATLGGADFGTNTMGGGVLFEATSTTLLQHLLMKNGINLMGVTNNMPLFGLQGHRALSQQDVATRTSAVSSVATGVTGAQSQVGITQSVAGGEVQSQQSQVVSKQSTTKSQKSAASGPGAARTSDMSNINDAASMTQTVGAESVFSIIPSYVCVGGHILPNRIYPVMLRSEGVPSGNNRLNNISTMNTLTVSGLMALQKFKSAVKQIIKFNKKSKAAQTCYAALQMWSKENRTKNLVFCVTRFLHVTRSIQKFWRTVRRRMAVDLKDACKEAKVFEEKHHLSMFMARRSTKSPNQQLSHSDKQRIENCMLEPKEREFYVKLELRARRYLNLSAIARWRDQMKDYWEEVSQWRTTIMAQKAMDGIVGTQDDQYQQWGQGQLQGQHGHGHHGQHGHGHGHGHHGQHGHGHGHGHHGHGQHGHHGHHQANMSHMHSFHQANMSHMHSNNAAANIIPPPSPPPPAEPISYPPPPLPPACPRYLPARSDWPSVINRFLYTHSLRLGRGGGGGGGGGQKLDSASKQDSKESSQAGGDKNDDSPSRKENDGDTTTADSSAHPVTPSRGRVTIKDAGDAGAGESAASPKKDDAPPQRSDKPPPRSTVMMYTKVTIHAESQITMKFMSALAASKGMSNKMGKKGTTGKGGVADDGEDNDPLKGFDQLILDDDVEAEIPDLVIAPSQITEGLKMYALRG